MMLSIITPVFNGEAFIESCIMNVVEQNCPDSEHIIIDGGSLDATVDIIRSYCEKYQHIRWISEKDRGQSDAMNKGIALAKGDVIGVLNVDDYYEPDTLMRITDAFRMLPVPSLLVGNCNLRGDDDVLLDVNRPANLKFEDLLIGDEVRNPFPVNPSAYFYHRSLHEHIGLYDVDDQYTMDIDFLLRAIPCAQVKYVDETLGNFRFIRGTKTFDDLRNGNAEPRLYRLLGRHRGELPVKQQLRIKILHALYRGRRKAKDIMRPLVRFRKTR
jgi:glycosyltransferase involved in cell wall biosynthesis